MPVDGSPDGYTQEAALRSEWDGVGESSVDVVVTELRRDDIIPGACAGQTIPQSSFHCWTAALTLLTLPSFKGEKC